MKILFFPVSLLILALVTGCEPNREVVETYADGSKKKAIAYLGNRAGDRPAAYIYYYSPTGELIYRENPIKGVIAWYPDLNQPLSRIKGLETYFQGEWLWQSVLPQRDGLPFPALAVSDSNDAWLISSGTRLTLSSRSVDTIKFHAVISARAASSDAKGDVLTLVISPQHQEGIYPCAVIQPSVALPTLDDFDTKQLKPECAILDHNTFIHKDITLIRQ
jgi:hypothetical protein